MYINRLSPSLRGEGGGERKGNPSRKLCLPKCEHFKHKNPLFGLNDWNIVIEKLMIVRKEVDCLIEYT
jgi:hypothetical protein